jgi:hypothetical protein
MGQLEGTAAETDIAVRVFNNTTEQWLLSYPYHHLLCLLLPDGTIN